jgi:hypothetical protein
VNTDRLNQNVAEGEGPTAGAEARDDTAAATRPAIRAALGLDTSTAPSAATPDAEGRSSMKRRIRFILAFAALAAVLLAVLAGPAGAATPVSKAQRELVILSTDLSQGGPLERALYDVVEMGGTGLGVTSLGTRYNAVHLLQGAGATQSNFVARLDQITARAGVRAVDVSFMTHGLTDNVVFATGGLVTVATVRNMITANLTTAQRAKLRMLFSTACFGASHRSAWREAGFKMVSGSREVYADSAASYPAFLGTWTVGGNFATAILAANVAGGASGWDTAASLWLSINRPSLASQVDSFRLTTGSTGLTINTMP